MTGVIATIPRVQFSNALGIPLAGGKLTTYLAGTTTPEPTYQDQDLTIANPTTITLDSTGSCTLWLDPTKTYKFLLKNLLGVTQPGWPVDNISGASTVTSLAPTLSLYATLKNLDAALATLAADGGSALIGFIQAGAGAVAMTVQDALRERVTIKQFGAKLDGAVDDGPAFNRAIFKLASGGGGIVRAGSGICKISTSILLPSNVTLDLRGCTLNGTGANTLIKSGALVAGALIDITVEDGTAGTGSGTNFVGNAQVIGGTLGNAACGIRAHRFNYGSTIEHVVFAVSLTNSWISSHSWGLKVHQNTVYSPAIMRDFVDWTEVSGNSFEGPSVAAGTTALTITTNGYGGSYSARFISNGFHHWTNGLVFSCEATNPVIESNHFEDTKFHVSGGALLVKKARVRNNWMKANLNPSGGGVIPIAFQSIWDSELGPNEYTADGTSTFDAHVSISSTNCFGNRIPLPYSPPGTLDLSMYQVGPANEILLRGGLNNPALAQPSIEVVSGSAGYTVEKYKSRYHNVANQIPYCATVYNAGTITIDTWIACTAYGVQKRVVFDFFISGATTSMVTGTIGMLIVKTDINNDFFSGAASTLIIAASNNGGALRITITGAPASGNITGWVREA